MGISKKNLVFIGIGLLVVLVIGLEFKARQVVTSLKNEIDSKGMNKKSLSEETASLFRQAESRMNEVSAIEERLNRIYKPHPKQNECLSDYDEIKMWKVLIQENPKQLTQINCEEIKKLILKIHPQVLTYSQSSRRGIAAVGSAKPTLKVIKGYSKLIELYIYLAKSEVGRLEKKIDSLIVDVATLEREGKREARRLIKYDALTQELLKRERMAGGANKSKTDYELCTEDNRELAQDVADVFGRNSELPSNCKFIIR